jgi:protease YdgD
MRRQRLVGALAAALMMAAGGPLAAQNSPLDRLTLRQDQLGWEGVGKLELGSPQEYCTATLIDTNLVLTAAHCVHDPRRGGAPRPPETLTFRAGYADGHSIADRRAVRVAPHPGFDPRAAVGIEAVRHDVALVELESPIPAATAAPFPVASPADLREVSVVSYAAGRDEALSWQKRCSMIGRVEGLFAFDCDVAPGSSGAPVFDRSGGRGRIVSIISAGGTAADPSGSTTDAMVAFGMELPALVDELKSALRSRPAPSVRAPLGQAEVRAGGARFVRPRTTAPAP